MYWTYRDRTSSDNLDGFVVGAGYIGFVDGKKMLFPTEGEYKRYILEREEK